MGVTRRSVCFGVDGRGRDELALVVEAAAAAGLSVNAWVRRACVETADLERSVAAEEGAPRVVVLPPPVVAVVHRDVATQKRAFAPDFKGGKR